MFDTASVISLLETKSIDIGAIAGDHFDNDERFTIIEKNISNHEENYTRFFLTGKNHSKFLKKKYSLCNSCCSG